MDVAINQLAYRAGEKPILKGVTARLAPCRLVCIMGPTGAGKSSLLNAIAHKAPKL